MDSLRARLDFLRNTQNVDGGWGYFPGKQSWLEPTAWAALALHGDERSTKAWGLIKSWQKDDGSCRPCASVPISNWTAALALTLATLHRDQTAVKRGVSYLLSFTGDDSSTIQRVAKFISPDHTDREPKFKGWPWRPGNTSWIEPTSHSVTALRLAGKQIHDGDIAERIESAQSMILHMRCKDGGWNYGARIALGTPLGSFPETSALALIGLAGRKDVGDVVQYVQKLQASKQSPLSRAWLQIALRMHGQTLPAPAEAPLEGQDILLAALEAFGSPEGNWRLLA